MLCEELVQQVRDDRISQTNIEQVYIDIILMSQNVR